MLAEARSQPTMECCGVLAGRGGIIFEVLPARNALQSATAYEIAPEELFVLFRRIREEGLDHLGIYHSHPRGDNYPSATDIEQAYYPETSYFILSPQTNFQSPVRAFRILEGHVYELSVEPRPS